MGAWGCNAFENDTAADWLADLPQDGIGRHVEDALQAALPSPLALMQKLAGKPVEEYLDADVACNALVAAELVAAWNGNAHAALPDAVKALLKDQAAGFNRDLAELARMAVARIGQASELRELWEETDEFSVWQQELAHLLRRLEA